ncbi:ferrochelatase [Ketogulonicigenium vulgare]|uniref:Ferrochelatase n=1 Tax=Ketogulonicigenium vulgare (strain WSH-001) TaxID=759362 RepID=F9Y668_KETVW|nr:ferrochelatase [Ketogulonicigenium vulgare]ADO43802.1 ferrochelatase [Ketogulonicigenium vulgare Y25]AEM42065.1 Ferrochelatase [Ketogulonicigenium vulgare WSH-001]ALJ82158.1 ferrochelatase [Ketogulonicigenium vulgare]ANW34779.1 ferrochelatase [Ketogulonicigenium vulgare]AOZ55836.1 ferrochelatase [Ketogulonicigenium vulgare]
MLNVTQGDSKIGVLIANLGTPDATDYWSVRRYLNEFLSDKRVIDYPAWLWQPILQLLILSRRPYATGANYKLIWDNERDESPLRTITRDQTDGIRAALHAQFGDRVVVDFCMRYGNPSTPAKLQEMVDAGCDKIVFFPLYPQFSTATTATANDKLFEAAQKTLKQPAIRTVQPYFHEPDYIAALANSIRTGIAASGKEHDLLVCTYHGMPERYIRMGDPYRDQCLETTRLLRAELGWDEDRIITTFQSRFGPEEWLKPYTVDHVAELAKAGKKSIAICSPAFSADCIETLEEINGEICESFEHAGGEVFTYIPCLNANPDHVALLTRLVTDNLKGWI